MEKRKMSREQNRLCLAGWGVVIFLILILLGIRITGFDYERWAMPCLLLEFTGIYCPGCGGTRAIKALLQGHFLQSLMYHPFVPYAALVGGWFLVSNTVEWVTGGRLSVGMKYKDRYLYIGLGIVMVHFVAQNFHL